MGSLLHPVGPEEPRVYWVRRSLVVVMVLALVATVAWLVWPREESISAAPPPVSPSSTPNSPSPPASAPATTPTPSPSPTPTGPLACDPTLMKLGVAGFQKVKVGAKNTAFSLTVTNNTKVACILTISPKTYTLTVASGKDRIWTTDHCAKWLPGKETILDGGATHEFTVTWTLRRSSKDCKLGKEQLKPGTYVATATLGEKASAKQVMQLVR